MIKSESRIVYSSLVVDKTSLEFWIIWIIINGYFSFSETIIALNEIDYVET